MANDEHEEVTHLESKTYVIGREGHIYINDATVSKQHAEIQVVNGEVSGALHCDPRPGL